MSSKSKLPKKAPRQTLFVSLGQHILQQSTNRPVAYQLREESGGGELSVLIEPDEALGRDCWIVFVNGREWEVFFNEEEAIEYGIAVLALNGDVEVDVQERRMYLASNRRLPALPNVVTYNATRAAEGGAA